MRARVLRTRGGSGGRTLEGGQDPHELGHWWPRQAEATLAHALRELDELAHRVLVQERGVHVVLVHHPGVLARQRVVELRIDDLGAGRQHARRDRVQHLGVAHVDDDGDVAAVEAE